MDELELIGKLRGRFGKPSPSVEVGIGDDAAVVAAGPGLRWTVTTDALVEGVHFDLGYCGPRDLGRKALAVSLSDVAAMGSEPRHAVLALTVRPGLDESFLDEVLDGVDDVATEHRVSLVGGNLSGGGLLSLTVTALGSLPAPGLTRSGGRPGDRLLVSGELGSSALGLALLRAGWTEGDGEEEALVRRHLAPVPRVAVGVALRAMARACVDISDGLGQDSGHLARESRCGAKIVLDRLPLSPAYDRLTRELPDRWAPAVSGGEDYELLFAVPPEMVRTASLTAQGVGVELTDIGELVEGEGVEVADTEDGASRSGIGGFRHTW